MFLHINGKVSISETNFSAHFEGFQRSYYVVLCHPEPAPSYILIT